MTLHKIFVMLPKKYITKNNAIFELIFEKLGSEVKLTTFSLTKDVA